MSRRHSVLTRLLKGLLAAWLVVLMTGAPLPALPRLSDAAKRAETAERFPCEACPCGCGTAEYCWKSCCCHTLAQRIAWADRNDVRPPESALEEAADRGIDVARWGVTRVVKKGLKPTLVAYQLPEKDATSLPPCCAARMKAAQEAKQGQNSDKSKKTDEVHNAPGVLLLKALACQGLLEQWLSIGTGPLPPITTWAPTLEFETALTEMPNLYVSFTTLPVSPPPEC